MSREGKQVQFTGKRSPLYEIHRAYHGHMIEFAGWELPVYYTGIIDEHQNVRRNVGLFDVSHMGKVEVKGSDALANLQRVLLSDVERMSISQVKYSALCLQDGGVVDDITVYLTTVRTSFTEKAATTS